MSVGRYTKDEEFGGLTVEVDGSVSVYEGIIAIARSKEKTKLQLEEGARTSVSKGDKLFWQGKCKFEIK